MSKNAQIISILTWKYASHSLMACTHPLTWPKSTVNTPEPTFLTSRSSSSLEMSLQGSLSSEKCRLEPRQLPEPHWMEEKAINCRQMLSEGKSMEAEEVLESVRFRICACGSIPNAIPDGSILKLRISETLNLQKLEKWPFSPSRLHVSHSSCQ